MKIIPSIRCLAIALFFPLFQDLATADPGPIKIKGFSGDASIMSVDGKMHSLTSGSTISQGRRIDTGDKPGSKVVIQWNPGALSIIAPGSSVTPTSLHLGKSANETPLQDVFLNLTKGDIFTYIAGRSVGTNVRIKTPEGVAAARGGCFNLSLVGGTCLIVTFSDEVTVTLPSGKIFRVPAGHICDVGAADERSAYQTDIVRIIQLLQQLGFTITGSTSEGYVISGEGVTLTLPPLILYSTEGLPGGAAPRPGPVGEPPLPPSPPASK